MQYYQGDFDEQNFNAKLNFLTYKKLELYVRLSTGVIRYQSQRNFLSNDKIISEAEGEALTSSLALGVEYRFKRQ